MKIFNLFSEPKMVTVEDFPLDWFEKIGYQKRKKGNQGKRKNDTRYKDIVTAFDIETTRLPDVDQSFMYIWQWAFGPDLVVTGRTWNELDNLIVALKSRMGEDDRLVVYVHNLSYEFQFLRAIHEWEDAEVFAVKSRKVAKATWEQLEFRCSYIHSNMGLSTYLKKMGAKHQKLSGKDFDYDKIRWPWTPLTSEEMQYCINDVIGLVEALTIEMEADGDNLYTIPITSTGYVRRDAKAAVRGDRLANKVMKEQLPDMEIYTMLREAFRGGNTHANRFYSGIILENVSSADRSSSYPDCQCNDLFPMSVFQPVQNPTLDGVLDLICKRHKAVLMRIAMSGDIHLRDPYWGCPYIPVDKCRCLDGAEVDNGRVLRADYLEITITDVDFEIITEEYECNEIHIIDAAQARYGKLPDALVGVTIDYYRRKTELKGIEDQEIYYTKNKNKLNSIYGMSAQDPVKQQTHYNGALEEPFYLGNENPSELLESYNSKAFLAYQHGVWITAWARYRLEEGIRLAGRNFVYCDTDSVKYLGEIDWSKYNAKRKAASIKSGAFATDSKGETHYMGVYEFEGSYEEFKTMGAKKYAYRKDGKLSVTIAGVNKELGAKELEAHGGLEAFENGFVFVKAGGTESIYNDSTTTYMVDGKQFTLYPNICIRPSTYELGQTRAYIELLKRLDLGQKVVDNY